jgi:phage-related protein
VKFTSSGSILPTSLNSLTEKVKEKIDYVLFLISVTDRIPAKFFKHIEGTDGLYEIRVEYGGNIYRVFACFDQGHFVILFNGFQKKTQKTPPKEIEKAMRIKTEYFIEKAKSKGHENKK